MAVPKRRTSKAKRDMRRSPNMKKTAPGLSICPQCHEPKLPHRVCPNCNYYDGKEVVASEMQLKTEVNNSGKQRAVFVWMPLFYYVEKYNILDNIALEIFDLLCLL